MKGTTETRFRQALNDVPLDLVIYKPPDDARNWKPCDYMVWWASGERSPIFEPAALCAWFEVKQTRAAGSFPLSEIRKSQRLGILEAKKAGIPYYLAIWWTRRNLWTISDANAVMSLVGVSATFPVLAGETGIDTMHRNLPSTLRAILERELL